MLLARGWLENFHDIPRKEGFVVCLVFVLFGFLNPLVGSSLKTDKRLGVNRSFNFFLTSLLLTASTLPAQSVTVLRNIPSTYVYPSAGFLPFNIHRATQTMLSLMLQGATFDNPQGVACALLKSDHDPKDPKQDVVVTLVGVNSGAGEIIYNVGLKDIRRFGTAGKGEHQFLNPTGVAINSDGDVAVADTGNHRIVLLKHDGLRLRWVKTIGKKGKAAGEFENPLAVAYDSQNNLYIADAGNNRIQVRNARGQFQVLDIQGLEAPCGLAVIDGKEAWVFYRQGNDANRLAVIDQMGARVQTFTLEGRPLAQMTTAQIADPPMKLSGCAFDYYGNLVATDIEKSCLRKFDRQLHSLVSFGGPGTGDFEFTEPRGIAFNRQFGQILVSEKDSVQYFWNGADALNLTVSQDKDQERVHFYLTERALVTAAVLGADGTEIKEFVRQRELEEGDQELDWSPDVAVSGDYQIKLKVMATYSSRDRVTKEIIETFSYKK
jgi:DNA-binding beta-propeller fold protein YncE